MYLKYPCHIKKNLKCRIARTQNFKISMEENERPTASHVVTPDQCYILALPEENLRNIFKYLPNICDKVSLACTAPKLRQAFADWASVRRHEVDADDLEEMSLPNLIDFFKIAGPFVAILHIDCASFAKQSLIVEFVAEFCKNLEEIYFINITDKFRYKELLPRLTNLKRVSMDCMDADDVLNFDLTSNTKLESFELINGCYTGQNLCGFPQLRELALRDCLLWNSSDFGLPLRNLRVLELDDCCFEVMHHSLYQKIAESCVQLEDLQFSGCDTDFEVMAQLPNLTRCILKTWLTSNELNVNFLASLAAKQGHKLVHLKLVGQFEITNEHARCIGQLSSLKELRWSSNDILDDDHIKYFNELSNLELFGMSWCGRVTDMGLMSLLRKCAQLKRLDIKDCDEISDQFVLNAINYCSKSQGRNLVLNVEGTKIHRDMLKHQKYLTPLNNVKLNFIKVEY